MKGRMYKLTGMGRPTKSPLPKGQRNGPPIPSRRKDRIENHLPRIDTIPLPDKLRGK